jgi:hypothetical protein
MTEHSRPVPFSRCFRCQSGCIHLACGNVTLTLTPVEFLLLAEEILGMRHQLKEESRSAREESAKVHAGSSFTM